MRIPRASLAGLMLALAGCATLSGRTGGTPIPDAGSPEARLYVSRCGACHAPPHPERLEYPGWERLLPLMERRMAERGLRPLGERERREILRYLKAHAR